MCNKNSDKYRFESCPDYLFGSRKNYSYIYKVKIKTMENKRNQVQRQYSQEEVDMLLDQQAAKTTAQVLKNNTKQFKEFNPELFKAYIDKFSDEDKIKALEVIIGINVFSTPKEEILEKIENLLK